MPRNVQRRNRKYNWKRLFNGEKHELQWARDFLVTGDSFRRQVLKQAKSYDIAVKVELLHLPGARIGHAKGLVKVQAFPGRPYSAGPPEDRVISTNANANANAALI